MIVVFSIGYLKMNEHRLISKATVYSWNIILAFLYNNLIQFCGVQGILAYAFTCILTVGWLAFILCHAFSCCHYIILAWYQYCLFNKSRDMPVYVQEETYKV